MRPSLLLFLAITACAPAPTPCAADEIRDGDVCVRVVGDEADCPLGYFLNAAGDCVPLTSGGGGGGGGQPTDTALGSATGTATGDRDSGGSGGGGGGGIEPIGFSMIEAGFGFDGATDRVRSIYVDDVTEQDPYYAMRAYDERGDGCDVIIESSGTVRPEDGSHWVDGAGLYLGWEMPADNRMTSDCADVLRDAEWIAFMESFQTDTVGIGVGRVQFPWARENPASSIDTGAPADSFGSRERRGTSLG